MKTTLTKPAGGYTLVEIMIVVAIVGLLASLAIPNFLESRGRSQATACINNLRHLDDAASQWALEHGKRTGDPIIMSTDLTPYIKLTANGVIPPCPGSGTYTLDTVGTSPVCSLSNNSPAHTLQ